MASIHNFYPMIWHKLSEPLLPLIFLRNLKEKSVKKDEKLTALRKDILAKDDAIVGIGSGQPSRLDSCEIAINKMRKFNLFGNNLVAASDAFFPFVDGIEKLVQSGVQAVIQPSGSVRDKEIIKFANDTDTILVFSKTRHFRH